jgi:hypothetical protein
MNPDLPKLFLEEAADKLGIGMEQLPDLQGADCRARATSVFSDGSAGGISTESLVGAERLTMENSWRLIEAFSFPGPVYVFGNLRDGPSVFRFLSLGDALIVIGEAPPFDFYIVDWECTFLLAHDEYDTLFGCGVARPFVRTIGDPIHGQRDRARIADAIPSRFTRLYVDGSMMLEALLLGVMRSIGGTRERNSVETSDLTVDVRRNDDFDQASLDSDPRDYLRYRYSVEIEGTEAVPLTQYLESVATIMQGIFDLGANVVASCDWEDALPGSGRLGPVFAGSIR